MKFPSISGVVMDMDGVLWRKDTPLPGIAELFQWITENRLPFALATNNSSQTPADHVAKLDRMGVPGVPERCIVTSSTATAAYLQRHFPTGTRVHVFGMEGLRHALLAAGFTLADGSDEPPVVVVGLDFNLSYDMLKRAALAIRAGATFIGTNPDKTFPSDEGLIPGAGSLIAALETASGQTATIIGKPHAPMFAAALEIVGTPPETTLMIGDRLETDILGGKRAGMKTALLFTGVNSPDDLIVDPDTVWPDVAYETLPDLVRAWAGDDWYQAQRKARRRRERSAPK